MSFSRKYVGIDLGAENIKVAHLIKTRKGWTVDSLLKMKNPVGRTSFSETSEIELLANCLAKIKKLHCKKVIMGVPNRHMAFRNMHFPKLTAKELNEAIFWECQEFSTVFNGEFVSDYHVVEEQPDYHRVFLAGAEKMHVQGYCQAAQKSGLNLVALDAYPLAIERILGLRDPDNITAVLDVGVYDSDLTVVEEGKLFFSRHIPLGSHTINKTISEAFFVDNDEAEAMKRGKNADENNVREAVLPFLKAITREISQFFHYYTLQTKGREVESLLLAGAGNKMRWLQELIHSQLKIPVVTANEVVYKLHVNTGISDVDYMDYFNAIGFALRG